MAKHGVGNPDNLPVEKLILAVNDAGLMRNISAIDLYWAEKTQFLLYERPPPISSMSNTIDTWCHKMESYFEDLKKLLELEHHRFWSTVVHNTRTMDMLISFLQEANPPYMPPYQSSKVNTLYQDIRRLVLIVFCRLISNKESKSEWMSKEYMKQLIYDKFIFTVPILWDICLVYGADNMNTVSRIFDSVLNLQPKYLTDLDAAIAFVRESFKYITMQVNQDFETSEPPNLPETFKGFGEIKRPSTNGSKDDKMAFSTLKDLVMYLLDTALTLRIFIEVYPKSVDMFKKRGLVVSIVQLYEFAMPQLYEKLEEVGDETSVTYTELEEYIDSTRAELIDILRDMLAAPKNAIFSGDGNIGTHIENYLSILMDALSERLLIKDYHACYPINEDIELLKQAYPNIDPVKTDFILQAVYSNLDEPVPLNIYNQQEEEANGIEPEETIPINKENEIPAHIREGSLISEVKDIFPDLGDGFVLKCLQHYNMSSERVINSILEDNLDAKLRNLDRSLPIIPVDPVDEKFVETGINRRNVFDGDEFDIMTRDDVDLSKIHTGKRKDKHKDLKDMLNDKMDSQIKQNIYEKYNLVSDLVDMYSDEYDDTYDDDGGPTPVGDSTDDMGRPFVTPRALQTGRQEEEESEEETQPPDTQRAGPSRNPLDFCTNPEEIRAKREANWRLKQNKGHRPPPPRNTDVVGKAKGQGQEKEVLNNRDKKEKNKSARANHNRRSGAQWKRSQGMMPS